MEKFPTAQIIISGILPKLIPLDRSNAQNRTIIELNELLERKCHDSVRLQYVSHEDTFVRENGLIRSDLYWDHTHMNNRGLGRFLFNLRNAIFNISCLNPVPTHPPKT